MWKPYFLLLATVGPLTLEPAVQGILAVGGLCVAIAAIMNVVKMIRGDAVGSVTFNALQEKVSAMVIRMDKMDEKLTSIERSRAAQQEEMTNKTLDMLAQVKEVLAEVRDRRGRHV